MKRTIGTVFCNYTYDAPYYSRILWEYFKKELKLWEGSYDKLYLVDSSFDFNESDIQYLEKLSVEVVIRRTHNMSAGQNLTFLVQEMQLEDNILLIHPDTLIWNKKIIERGFEDLQTYDTVAIFDGSGKHLADKFPIMAENKLRSERRRFCNYLWFQRNDLFRRIEDLDFEPVGKFGDYGEATSYVTEKLLEMGVNAKELRDDRSNISFEINPFRILKTQWLDSGDKLWGQDYPLDLGYYHIRNGNGGAELINEFYNLPESFARRKQSMPLSEVVRLLGWHQLLAQVTNQPLEIKPVVAELGILEDEWDEYTKAFNIFHSYALI